MADMPLLPLDVYAKPAPPSIFFVCEDPDQAYRVSEVPFPTDPNNSLETSARLLCERLHIPPLSSYLMSACLHPNLANDVRRWLPPGERPVRSSELRLCCRHFSPRQLAFLSDDLLHYHFLTVKFDLLRKRRIRVARMDSERFRDFVSRLLTLDICRILAKTRDERSLNKFISDSDLITSLVRKYEEFFFEGPGRLNPIKRLAQALLWKQTPALLHGRRLPDLIKKIEGKHWTDYVITYLKTVEEACPTIRSNRYQLCGNRNTVELGSDGLVLLGAGRQKNFDASSIVSAWFRTQRVIELEISGPNENVCLEFESEIDAQSFAAELSCYSRILAHFSRPIFSGSQADVPPEHFQAPDKCLGPLSTNSDLHAVYQASALLASAAESNAIAFESSATYGIVGVLAVHKESHRETVRWYRKRFSREDNELEFEEVATATIYPSLQAAAAAQLIGLMHFHAEADQDIQPNLFFNAESVLPPIQLISNDRLVDDFNQRNIIRDRKTFIHGGFNTVEVARLGQQTVALKYARLPNRAVNEALDRSQNWLMGLKRRLCHETEEAGLVFRQLLASIDRDQMTLPRCMILEYFDEPLSTVLNKDGMRYSLYHLLQACSDLVKAVYFLDKFGFVHGEISCKKLLVRQKPAPNGFGELRMKLAEPCFHVASDAFSVSSPSTEDDLLDVGKTMQEIFFLSTPSAQLRESNQMLMAINFDSFFDNAARYAPYLPRDPFQIVADGVQLVVLSLLGPSHLRMPLLETRERLETMVSKIAMSRFSDLDIDRYNSIMADRRIYGCDAKDLSLATTGDQDGAENPETAKLGEGRFAVVWKVRHAQSDQLLALKVLKTQNFRNDQLGVRQMTESLKAELNLQLRLTHPNVARFCGFQHDRHGLITGILMTYYERGSLLRFLKAHRSISRAQELTWALEIAKGMTYLHDSGVIHRDLAARNILLGDDLTAKISDFGLAICGPSLLSEEYPSLWWPPEWRDLNRRLEVNEEDVFEKSGDVYSYGILLWEIDNNGRHPKFLEPQNGLVSLLLTNDQGSEHLQRLTAMCTLQTAGRRPTFSELVDELTFL